MRRVAWGVSPYDRGAGWDVDVIKKYRLDGVVFEGWGEAGDALTFGGALDFDAQLVFFFGAGFAKDGDGAEGFVVDAGDQEGVTALQILPELTDLNFSRSHPCKSM